MVPRRLIIQAIRGTLDRLRTRILNGGTVGDADLDHGRIARQAADLARELARPVFRRVINATGVIIHTNLGRSLLAPEAMEAIRSAGLYYSNLEYNLEAGARGSRYSHVEGLLCDLTGAEAALVVNNNAAAVLIALETLAKGREVVVSRGELVEIGGAFRIPEVMERSGAILCEIGTTNKTHLHDYENAVNENTALFLKVHQSNFRIVGFTESVALKDVVASAARFGLPVMEDLGSGNLMDLSKFGTRKEPTVQETVAAGADVVTFSGDKLLGGPQAGIILGRRDMLDRIRQNPLNRAMRIDKFTLAGLEATLRLYLDDDLALRVPTIAMIAAAYPDLKRRAARLKKILTVAGTESVRVDWADGYSQIGGGALPSQDLKTRLVLLRPLHMSTNRLEEWFRSRPTPIIGRIEDDAFILDVRTIKDEEFQMVGSALAELPTDGDE